MPAGKEAAIQFAPTIGFRAADNSSLTGQIQIPNSNPGKF